jgi:hypothetical protein
VVHGLSVLRSVSRCCYRELCLQLLSRLSRPTGGDGKCPL